MTLYLSVREGDGDAKRTGYWIVVGPQDEHDMYGIVERSRITPDDDQVYVAHRWYLHQRTLPERNSSATYMRTIANGEGDTLSESLEQLRAVWPTEDLPEPTPDPLERLWPRTDI